MTRLLAALRALPAELQQAALAAAALMLTLFLPWYTARVLTDDAKSFNTSAFGEFSFVEAAVLLVAAGVLYLAWARSQRKAFHLPGGDGTVIMVAGGWAALLIVWRLFDTPEAKTIEYGLQWGIFVALAAAAALAVAGARVRAAHRPEPPNPAADEPAWERPPPRERRRTRGPREATAVTEVLRDRPGWEGEPPEPPRRARRPSDPPATERGPEARPPADDPPPDRLF